MFLFQDIAVRALKLCNNVDGAVQLLCHIIESRNGSSKISAGKMSFSPYLWLSVITAYTPIMKLGRGWGWGGVDSACLSLVSPVHLSVCLSVSLSVMFPSPWYNRIGWLGVKHQLTLHVSEVVFSPSDDAFYGMLNHLQPDCVWWCRHAERLDCWLLHGQTHIDSTCWSWFLYFSVDIEPAMQ